MKFKKLELQDRELFLKYLGEYKFYTYEYSFTTLYLWRQYLNVEFAVNDKYLLIRKKCNEIGSYFMEPLGYDDNDLKHIVKELNEMRIKFDMNYLFRDVEEEFLNKLIDIFGDRIEYKEDENNFDYIYNTVDLATLAGGKLKKKRTRYNVFVKEHDGLRVEYFYNESMSNGVKEKCKKLAQNWYDNQDIKNEEIYYELKGITDLFNQMLFLNVKVIIVYCKDKIIGFSIGEVINDSYALIHIEKCNKDYNGVYEYINKVFIENCFYNTKFINRGEDAGNTGLKQAKMGYRPVKLGKKYIVNLK